MSLTTIILQRPKYDDLIDTIERFAEADRRSPTNATVWLIEQSPRYKEFSQQKPRTRVKDRC